MYCVCVCRECIIHVLCVCRVYIHVVCVQGVYIHDPLHTHTIRVCTPPAHTHTIRTHALHAYTSVCLQCLQGVYVCRCVCVGGIYVCV